MLETGSFWLPPTRYWEYEWRKGGRFFCVVMMLQVVMPIRIPFVWLPVAYAPFGWHVSSLETFFCCIFEAIVMGPVGPEHTRCYLLMIHVALVTGFHFYVWNKSEFKQMDEYVKTVGFNNESNCNPRFSHISIVGIPEPLSQLIRDYVTPDHVHVNMVRDSLSQWFTGPLSCGHLEIERSDGQQVTYTPTISGASVHFVFYCDHHFCQGPYFLLRLATSDLTSLQKQCLAQNLAFLLRLSSHYITEANRKTSRVSRDSLFVTFDKDHLRPLRYQEAWEEYIGDTYIRLSRRHMFYLPVSMSEEEKDKDDTDTTLLALVLEWSTVSVNLFYYLTSAGGEVEWSSMYKCVSIKYNS